MQLEGRIYSDTRDARFFKGTRRCLEAFRKISVSVLKCYVKSWLDLETLLLHGSLNYKSIEFTAMRERKTDIQFQKQSIIRAENAKPESNMELIRMKYSKAFHYHRVIPVKGIDKYLSDNLGIGGEGKKRYRWISESSLLYYTRARNFPPDKSIFQAHYSLNNSSKRA